MRTLFGLLARPRAILNLGSLCLVVPALSACGGRSSLNDFKDGVGVLGPGDNPDAGLGDGADGAGDGDGSTEEDGGQIEIPDGSDGQPGDGSDGEPSDGNPGDGNPGDGSPGDGDGDPTPGDVPVGAGCEDGGDCGSDGSCLTELGMGGVSIELPGGYCTVECGDGCPDGSECLDAGVMFGFPASCIQTCDDASDCRDGYDCGALPIGGDATTYCLPPFGFGG